MAILVADHIRPEGNDALRFANGVIDPDPFRIEPRAPVFAKAFLDAESTIKRLRDPRGERHAA